MRTTFLALPLQILGLASHLLTRRRIWNYTRTVKPGKSLTLNGEFSENAQVWFNSLSQPTPTQLAVRVGKSGVAAQTYGSVIVGLPSSVLFEEYRVWIVDGALTTEPVFINRAEIWDTNCPEFAVGAYHELHGRNLMFTPGVGTLKLVPQDGSASVTAVVDVQSSTSLYLRYQVPAGLVEGKLYKPTFYNGYGYGYYAEAPEYVRCITGGTDYLGVSDRVPNAVGHRHAGNVYIFGTNARDSRFPASVQYNGQTVSLTLAGNKTTSDSMAINAAMAWINTQVVNGVGGGQLKLLVPSVSGGAYLITESLNIPSSVSLFQEIGAFITVNPTGGGGRIAYVSNGTLRASLLNPQFINPSTTSTAQADMWKPLFVTGTTGFICKGGNLDLGESTWLNFQNNTMLAHLDTTIRQGAAMLADPRRGPASYNGCSRLIIDGLSIYSTIDAMDVTFVNGFTVQNCKMYWNAALGNKQTTVTHFWAFGGSSGAYLRKNYCKANWDANNPKVVAEDYRKLGGQMPANDKECFIAERGGSYQADNICAQVTGSSATSLTCKGVDFSQLSFPTPVVLIAGLGAGQDVVAISGTADGVLTIQGTWDVQPDSSTRFSTCRWTLNRCNLELNVGEDSGRFILLYYGHFKNVNIVNNKATRCGSIDIAPKFSRDGDVPNVGVTRVTVCLAPYINGNVIDWRGDPVQAGGIALHPNPFKQNIPYGTQIFGATVTENQVLGSDVTRLNIVDAPILPGLAVYTQAQLVSDKFVDVEEIPTVLGTLVEDNYVTGNMYGLVTGSGVHNLYAGNNRLVGNGTNVLNQLLDGSNSPARSFAEFNTTTV